MVLRCWGFRFRGLGLRFRGFQGVLGVLGFWEFKASGKGTIWVQRLGFKVLGL